MAKHEKIVESDFQAYENAEELNDGVVEEELALDGLILATRGEARPLQHIEDGLKNAIIGQPEAIEALTIALNRRNLRNPNRPITTVALLGPTGVGKTETPIQLAQLLHPEGGGYLQINCGTYSQGHNISELIGSAPGYVGHDLDPVFASKELKKDRCVVCFDEIEKASGPLFDLLLQIMDKGEVSLLNKGKKQSFRNAIIVLTSNVGSAEISKTAGFGFGSETPERTRAQIKTQATNALEKRFRPEFINRINRIVTFDRLDDEKLAAVLDRYVEKQNKVYMGQAGISLHVSPEVRDAIIASCPERIKYNARPVIDKYEYIVENMLAEYVNSGGIKKGQRVYALLSKDAPSDAPLEDRLELRYNPHETPVSGDDGASKHAKETLGSTSAAANSHAVVGLAAAAGVAALLIGDYMSSRRARRA